MSVAIIHDTHRGHVINNLAILQVIKIVMAIITTIAKRKFPVLVAVRNNIRPHIFRRHLLEQHQEYCKKECNSGLPTQAHLIVEQCSRH